MKSITILVTLTVIGLLLGYGNYHFYGCRTNCMIASSPIRSTIYGGVLGVLLGLSLKKGEKL